MACFLRAYVISKSLPFTNDSSVSPKAQSFASVGIVITVDQDDWKVYSGIGGK